MGKKILLIQVDGKFANPALMKLSTYHKSKGHRVFLDAKGFRVQRCNNPDEVYISCIFSWNRPKVLGMAKLYNCEVHVGGGGIGEAKLPDEIEHLMPDYGLYGIDYSIGYTQRGCIRNCPWCLVPKLEGQFREHAPITEFWNPKHRKIIILDNNFLASKLWKEKLEFIIINRLEVSICQGLDIRLIDNEKAKWLILLRSMTPSFRSRIMHFAFDDKRYEKAVRKGVEIFKTYGFNPYGLRFYMLCGFFHPNFHEDDYYRFKVLRELGVQPYVMIYRDPKNTRFKFDPLLKKFERWANRPGIYKSCKFSEYKYLSKEEKKRLEEMNLGQV